MGVESFSCNLGGKLEVNIMTKVVEADLPLLLGNTQLKKAMVVKLVCLGRNWNWRNTKSGHFRISVSIPDSSKGFMLKKCVPHNEEHGKSHCKGNCEAPLLLGPLLR